MWNLQFVSHLSPILQICCHLPEAEAIEAFPSIPELGRLTLAAKKALGDLEQVSVSHQ